MKFYKLSDARYHRNSHSVEFRKKLQIVKSRHWSVDGWCWIPCYTVVMR